MTLLVCSLLDDQMEKYTSLLRTLNGEFSRHFEDFKVLENDMLLVSSPFTLWMWIMIPLTCILSLSIFSLMQWSENYSKQFHWQGSMHLSMNKTFKRLGVMLRRCLYCLGQPMYCVCEQTFSVKKYNKSRHRSSLTDSHLSAILRIAMSKTIPDFTALVNAHQRLHSSHRLSSLNVMLSSLSFLFFCA